MVKQIIVVRKDLNMPVGKIAAQVAHCSMKIFFDRMSKDPHDTEPFGEYFCEFTPDMFYWMENSFTKVVVGCKNLNELLKLEQKAIDAGIPCAKIEDNGNTVFRKKCEVCKGSGKVLVDGLYYDFDLNRKLIPVNCGRCAGKGTIAVPTITCLAVGPADSDVLDPITGRLRLL